MRFWCPSCSAWCKGFPVAWPLSERAGMRCSFRAPLVLMRGGTCCQDCADKVTKLVQEVKVL